MTPQEHLFLLSLYAHQNFKFNLLFEALVSASVLQPDDLVAYADFAIEQKPEQMKEALRVAWKYYQATAASLGITTGLEHSPPFPNQV